MTKLERIRKLLISYRVRHMRVINEGTGILHDVRYRLGQVHMIDAVMRLMDDEWLEVEEEREARQNEVDQTEGEIKKWLQESVWELQEKIDKIEGYDGYERI